MVRPARARGSVLALATTSRAGNGASESELAASAHLQAATLRCSTRSPSHGFRRRPIFAPAVSRNKELRPGPETADGLPHEVPAEYREYNECLRTLATAKRDE